LSVVVRTRHTRSAATVDRKRPESDALSFPELCPDCRALLLLAPRSRCAAGFSKYELEEDVTKDLVEFALANGIYAALIEGHAAEISARRTAMENASKVRLHPPCDAARGHAIRPRDGSMSRGRRALMSGLSLPSLGTASDHRMRSSSPHPLQNAKDMIGSLQMKYNRGRQAVITNELCVALSRPWSRPGAVGYAAWSGLLRLLYRPLTLFRPRSFDAFSSNSIDVRPTGFFVNLIERSRLTLLLLLSLADHHRCLGPLSRPRLDGWRWLGAEQSTGEGHSGVTYSRGGANGPS
jgi:hypothetical protein